MSAGVQTQPLGPGACLSIRGWEFGSRVPAPLTLNTAGRKGGHGGHTDRFRAESDTAQLQLQEDRFAAG